MTSCKKHNDSHEEPQNPAPTATVVIYTSLLEHKDFRFDFGPHIKDMRLPVYNSHPDCSSSYFTIKNVPLHDSVTVVVKDPYDSMYWNEMKLLFDSVGCYAINVY